MTFYLQMKAMMDLTANAFYAELYQQKVVQKLISMVAKCLLHNSKK